MAKLTEPFPIKSNQQCLRLCTSRSN